jgi:antitoxin component YwqK of YwqJK toxin-antitoxin module
MVINKRIYRKSGELKRKFSKNGEITSLSNYFKNGNVKDIYYMDMKTKKVYLTCLYYKNRNIKLIDILNKVYRFYRNGKLKFITKYKNNKPHGISKEYNKRGKLIHMIYYQNGKIIS